MRAAVGIIVGIVGIVATAGAGSADALGFGGASADCRLLGQPQTPWACSVAQSGQVSVAWSDCSPGACLVRASGAASGRSDLPGYLTLVLAMWQSAENEERLCTNVTGLDTTTTSLACATSATGPSGLRVVVTASTCATFEARTTLTQGNVAPGVHALSVRTSAPFKICRDSLGAPRLE